MTLHDSGTGEFVGRGGGCSIVATVERGEFLPKTDRKPVKARQRLERGVVSLYIRCSVDGTNARSQFFKLFKAAPQAPVAVTYHERRRCQRSTNFSPLFHPGLTTSYIFCGIKHTTRKMQSANLKQGHGKWAYRGDWFTGTLSGLKLAHPRVRQLPPLLHNKRQAMQF